MSAHAAGAAPAAKRARPDTNPGVVGAPSGVSPTAHRPVMPSGSLITAMPRDLLRLVFGYLPHYTRLCHVAPVCKRWCDAARSSITRHPQGMSLSSAAKLLPSLAHARLQSVDDRLVKLPQTLRSLHVTKDTYALCSVNQCLWQRATHLSGLTALKYHGFASCKHLDGLVTSLATQLTRLDLPYLTHDGPLSKLSFPALASLRALRTARILAESRLTLTSLTLMNTHDPEPLPVFPRVHTLALTSMADIADALRLFFPTLTTLRMIGPLHAPLPISVRSAVAALRVVSALENCAPHLARITALTVSQYHDKSLAWLEQCTSLTSLHIEVATNYENLARLTLPRLCKLVITEDESCTWPLFTFDTALEVLRSTVRTGQPPCAMHLNVWPEEEKLGSLLELLLQAEALGMEKFLVPDSPAAVRVVRAARERLAWLHVGLNAYPKPQLSEHF